MSSSIMSSPQKNKITDLPPELIDAICQCTAAATRSSSSTCCTNYAALCALALTSSSFRYTSQRVLFSCVSILIASSRRSPGTTATSHPTVITKWYDSQRRSGMKLLRTLNDSSRLASYARKLECRIDCAGLELEEGAEGFGDVLHGVLANMHGLLDLTLVLPENLHHESSASHLLTSANLPLLHSLFLSFPLDTNVLRFLARAPRLQKIELSPGFQGMPVTLPQEGLGTQRFSALSSFSGSLADALRLLSGQMGRVKEVYICRPQVTLDQDTREVVLDDIVDDDGEEELLRRLFESDERAALETLELHTSLAPLPALALLASFPSLRDVRAMRLVVNSTLEATAPGMDFHHAIASQLTSFPLLASFNLCGVHWSCSPPPSPSSIAPGPI